LIDSDLEYPNRRDLGKRDDHAQSTEGKDVHRVTPPVVPESAH
jgi:hypothetical protein